MIYLSFDVEEFDVPLENGASINDVPFHRQVKISTVGLERIFEVLKKHNVRATFFCTANYALAKPHMIKRMVEMGSEVASHSYHHSAFEIGDLLRSKQILEQISDVKIRGYRSPRMGAVSADDLYRAGYEWDSSLNPCFLPGRYNNFKSPTMPYREDCGLIELPASVTPIFRLPLFWLMIHSVPIWSYLWLSNRSYKKTGFLNVYMHPWEFSDNLHEKDLRIQYIIKHNSGLKIVSRLDAIIEFYKKRGANFETLSHLADTIKRDKSF